jgi:hypothetical protein
MQPDEDEQRYEKVLMREGVRTTISMVRFEIFIHPKSEIWEQQAVQMLRQWIRRQNGIAKEEPVDLEKVEGDNDA